MTFFLSMLFMFWVFWRPQEWLFWGLYGLPILDLIFVASVFALLIESSQRLVRFARGPVPWLILGLWFASLMSHVANTYLAGLIRTFGETTKICLFTYVLYITIDSPERIRRVAFVMVAMAGFMTVHATLQTLTERGFGGQPPITIRFPWRDPYTRTWFFGIFSDPNDLAQMLTMAIPLVFLIPRRLNLISFSACLAMAGFLLYGVLTTHSRGGNVGLLAAGCTMLALAVLPEKGWPMYASLALAGGLLACAMVGGSLLDSSARMRVVFWGLGNRQFKSHPIFGIGYGMYWMVASDRAAHNAFVNCYTEMGFFGYWFWFGLLQLGIVANWRTSRALRGVRSVEGRYLRRAAVLGIASMVGFAASAYFLSRTWIYPCFFLFALLNAIPHVARKFLPDTTPPLIAWRRDVLKIGTIGALVSVFFIYFSILILNRICYG